MHAGSRRRSVLFVTLSLVELGVSDRRSTEAFDTKRLQRSGAHMRATSFIITLIITGGSVAEWLACWTQAQKGPGSNCSRDAVGYQS